MAGNISNLTMSIFRVISICFVLQVFNCCSGNTRQIQQKEGLQEKVTAYWDSIDASSLSGDSLEQSIVDYLYLIGHLDSHERERMWPKFYKKMPEHPNRTVVDYLGDSNSPLHSTRLLEEYLINLLKYTEDTITRIRTEYLLENYRKNNVGSTISNIKVITKRQKTSLHKLIQEAGQSCLIIFYDPDCSSCDAVFERLKEQKPTGLRVIAISITGMEKDIDKSWVSAFVEDEAEMDEKFYYASLPSIYIVSDEGIIVKKDILP